jgi:predicted 3-demethylubiquinone-9 3-methyltransferase (glyoxalase superfamily)
MNNTHFSLFKDGELFAVIKNNPSTISVSVEKAISEEFGISDVSIIGLDEALRKVQEYNQDVSFSFTDDEDDETEVGIGATWEYNG